MNSFSNIGNGAEYGDRSLAPENVGLILDGGSMASAAMRLLV